MVRLHNKTPNLHDDNVNDVMQKFHVRMIKHQTPVRPQGQFIMQLTPSKHETLIADMPQFHDDKKQIKRKTLRVTHNVHHANLMQALCINEKERKKMCDSCKRT